ncbi:MAG: hypothetical protein L0H24_10045, partial [Microlunatus sp.]|nr:hypothetical protein [Microlunatus sp.]
MSRTVGGTSGEYLHRSINSPHVVARQTHDQQPMDDIIRTRDDPVIFLEKVRRPMTRGLVRERLARRLAELRAGGQDGSCVLVLAPPGAGKTTLLSQLVELVDAPVGWYRAGAEDGDEVALTRHLGYALGSALGQPSVI